MNEKNQNSQEPEKEETQKQAQATAEEKQGQDQQSPQGAVANNAKVWSIVGYILPILFFLPLVMEDLKSNKYSKFHANQQLVLLLTGIAVNIVGGIIPILGWFIILPFGSLAVIVLAIIGIINGVKEKAKPLPLIGGIEIIK